MLAKVPPSIGAALLEATFKAFAEVVKAAIINKVDFVVIAGDVYDGASHSTRAQIRFAEELEKLDACGISCFVAHGNHDPLEAWYAQYRLPATVHQFGAAEVECVPVIRDSEIVANVYGISHGRYNIEENLVKRFSKIDKTAFSIGVLHCNVGNLNADRYAPCTIENLAVVGMDYWALGHVHTQQILYDNNPMIIYPGNTQGVSVRETGPRGCYLVEIDEQCNIKPTFIETGVIRWEQRSITITGMTGLYELMSAMQALKEEVRCQARGRGVILRISLTGRGMLDKALRGLSSVISLDVEEDLAAQLRLNEEHRPDFVWIEAISVCTRPEIDIAARRKTPDFVGDFLKRFSEVRAGLDGLNPGEKREELIKIICRLVQNRPEFNKISFMLEQFSTEELISLLEEAEMLGLNLLVAGEETCE